MNSSINSSMDSTGTTGCGCPACQSGQANDLVNYTQAQYESEYAAQLESGSGGLSAPGPAADPNTFANYLTNGFWTDIGASERSWTQNNITFSLSNEFSADQKAGLRMAFDLWADVADIDFTEVASGANITVLEGDDGRAYSQSWTSGTTIATNTISIDTNTGGGAFWSDFNDLGDYALMTALHEIGHSLGLGHTGNYNGSASYGADAQWANDSHQMTVMSYFADTNVGSDHWDSSGFWQYSATPMLIDILAIQNIYGADYGTRNTDTTYGFNSNAGHAQYDFSVSEVPIAIWDGGGTDTIDLSGYSTTNTLYLTEGDFSSVGYMTNNLVIAYNAVIENAVGGSGTDTIYGNDANNVIRGGLGNDTIYGSIGNDTLDGEGGTDTVSYSYAVNEFAFNFIDSISLSITHLTLGFTDLLSNMENYIFAGISYTRAWLESNFGTTTHNGGNTDDKLVGSAGDEEFYGQGGNDFIRAMDGDDLAYGGTGNDIFFGGFGTNRFYGESGDDYFVLSGGNDTVDGGTGRDEIRYLYSDDAVEVNLLAGTVDEGRDGSVEDTLVSIEYVVGSRGDDLITGNALANRIQGWGGDDVVYGGGGHDNLSGNDGNDTIYGDAGNDGLWGQNGDDVLYGGTGVDQLYGGADADTFVFRAADLDGSTDVIGDFSLGQNDAIDISDILTGYNQGVDAITDFVQITNDGTHSYLSVDANGGANSFVQIAQINNNTGLNNEALLETNGHLITV